MKTLFDISPIQSSYSGINNGGSEYCKRVLFSIGEKGKLEKIDVVYDSNIGIPEDVMSFLNNHHVLMLSYKTHSELSMLINNYAIFYSAMAYTYFDVSIHNTTKFIYTIHGLRDIEMPFDKYAVAYDRNLKTFAKSIINKFFPQFLVNRAKDKINKLLKVTTNREIIAVSNHTKFSMLANLKGITDAEINVLYSPCKNSLLLNQGRKKYDDYFLMVSGNRWLKNNLRAAIAADQLIGEKKINYKIVITGVRNQKVYLSKIKNRENFIFLDYVSDDALENLYFHTSLFIYPSLNEGFGYPPIEAIKYSSICICAADTSTTEVCGDSVLYFNPYDIMEIKTRIIEALDPSIRTELLNKMNKQYEKILTKQNNDLDVLIEKIIGN